MSVARYGCAAACVDGLLYVVGGLDENGDALASAECYDPSTGDWRALADMSLERYECAAACIDGLLYVAGGQDCIDGALAIVVASAECYDPSTKQWRGLPDMSVARANFVVVALP
jgi:N-acetylneuraminic acid mutarotase